MIADWLATALVVWTAAAALAALSARSLFAMIISAAAMAAAASSAALLLGGGGVVIAAFGVGVAPTLLLAGVLLSARAASVQKNGVLWLQIAAAVCAVGAVVLMAPELGVQTQAHAGASAPNVLWLALLVFVASVACVALLGYGERGVLQRRVDPDA